MFNTLLADSSVHSTRVIYHFWELGYNITGNNNMIVFVFVSVC